MHKYVLRLNKYSYEVYCIDCGKKKLTYLKNPSGANIMDPFKEYEHILKIYKGV